MDRACTLTLEILLYAYVFFVMAMAVLEGF